MSTQNSNHQHPSDFLNNSLLVRPIQVGQMLGLAKQTVYNLISQNRFPIPLVQVVGIKMVRISDLTAYVNGLNQINVPSQIKRRGRPTKAQSIASAQEKARGLK